MSSAAQHRDEPPTESARPRVLVIRSCRAEQFTAAVALARTRHPMGEIVALSHVGHRDALLASGVDRVVEVPGRRFGVLRLSPWRLLALRLERFDEVVVPQMSSYPDAHVNLYWLAAAMGPRRIVVTAPDAQLEEFAPPRFRRYALRHSLAGTALRFDAVLFVGLLIRACFARRVPMPAATGRRRRVLHIISSMGVGGAQVQLAEVINRTPPADYEIDLLVLGRSDGDFSRQWLKRDDVEIRFVQQWPRLAPSVREIARFCREGRYDIVHTWLFMANCVGVAAARLAGVPLVIASVRNLSVWKREWWYRKWWFRIGDVLGSHAADVVTVNARALVEDHARWAMMPSRGIEVIHNGLDPAHFAWARAEARQRLLETVKAPDNAILIGTVGRLAFEKDQATFIRMLALVRQDHKNAHGVVVGNGERRAALERLAADLGIANAVTFLGERSDARRLAAGFDLFVLTSRSEGFPNVLLEATFLGVPCVATNIAGNPDVLALDESLFPAGDVQRGTQRVLEALADMPQTIHRAAVVRRRALELFTAERSVASWLDLYRRHLLARTPGVSRRSLADVAALQVSETR